ncbi:MAG: hypothetical protein ACYSU7_07625 [Planctomycetota bacterium]|jgi:hypothetical protein
MADLDYAVAAAALLLAAPLAAAGGDPDSVVLTSSTRSITLVASIDDGVNPDGDFFMDSSNTLADWQASHALKTVLSGGTADCAASHMSSTTPDSFAIALSCTAGSSNPGALPESQASAISSFQLEFTVVETAVFAVDASLQSEFVSFEANSQSSYQLEEVSGCEPGENCLIMDFNACGFLVKLVPGTYRLSVGCIAFSQQFSAAGDTEVTGSADVTFLRVEPTEFFVDPAQSLFAVDVFVPGSGTQHVETPAGGFIRAAFSECTQFGSCQVLLVDGDLQAVNPEMTINTPIGDFVVSVDTVSLVESGGPIGLLPGASCGYPDGCCGTPSSAFVHTAGEIAGIPYSQDLDLCTGLGACDLVILCGSGPCDCSSQCPGVTAASLGPGSTLQLVLPDIEYTAEIDLGLGDLNPSATFTGQIAGDAAAEPEPCPWDCDPPHDGDVGITDFLQMLTEWGGPGLCDFDGGGVSITDFLALVANWGPCP